MPTTSEGPRLPVRKPLQLKHGEMFGGYKVVSRKEHAAVGDLAEPLGSGGGGMVYKVEQQLFDASVPRALKILQVSDEAAQKRADLGLSSGSQSFRAEVRTMATVAHENLVAIIAASEERNVPFFVMELVEGLSLEKSIARSDYASIIEKNPLKLLQIASAIASALRYLHSRHIYHRDIAPKNIFVTNLDNDKPLRVKIGDLGVGIAIPPDRPDDERVPVLGTRAFMSEDLAELKLKRAEISIADCRRLLPYGDVCGAAKTLEALLAPVKSSDRVIRLLRTLVGEVLSYRIVTATEFEEAIERSRPEHLVMAGVPELPSSRAVQPKYLVLPGAKVAVTPRLERLLQHPAIQRLRRVPQMQFADSVLPGATHTRFEHSLGAFRNMERAITSLMSDETFHIRFRENDQRVAILAALLSSIHCFPLYHIVCELRMHGIESDELKTDQLVRRIMDRPARLSPPLRSVIEHEFQVDVDRLIGLLSSDPEPPNAQNPFANRVIKTLLDSSFDVRVTDYVLRDTVHTGVLAGAGVDVEQIYHHLRVDDDGQVGFEPEALPAVEQLLLAKFWMYEHVYWSSDNRAAIAMLTRLLLDLQAKAGSTFSQFVETLSDTPLEEIPRAVGMAAMEYGVDAASIASCFGARLKRYVPVIEITGTELTGNGEDVSAVTAKLTDSSLREHVAVIARRLGLNPIEVLIDVPPAARGQKFGADVLVMDGRTTEKAISRSAIIDALQHESRTRLLRLRVYVHPDRAANVIENTAELKRCRDFLRKELQKELRALPEPAPPPTARPPQLSA